MRVRVGSLYVYQPNGFDVVLPKTDLKAGTKVRVIQLPNAPKANTMGHCYVETIAGEFKGLVSTSSLEKAA